MPTDLAIRANRIRTLVQRNRSTPDEALVMALLAVLEDVEGHDAYRLILTYLGGKPNEEPARPRGQSADGSAAPEVVAAAS